LTSKAALIQPRLLIPAGSLRRETNRQACFISPSAERPTVRRFDTRGKTRVGFRAPPAQRSEALGIQEVARSGRGWVDPSICDDAGSATAFPYSRRVSADARPKKGQKKAGVNPGGEIKAKKPKKESWLRRKERIFPRLRALSSSAKAFKLVTIP
jgi:hypothetical protein